MKLKSRGREERRVATNKKSWGAIGEMHLQQENKKEGKKREMYL